MFDTSFRNKPVYELRIRTLNYVVNVIFGLYTVHDVVL